MWHEITFLSIPTNKLCVSCCLCYKTKIWLNGDWTRLMQRVYSVQKTIQKGLGEAKNQNVKPCQELKWWLVRTMKIVRKENDNLYGWRSTSNCSNSQIVFQRTVSALTGRCASRGLAGVIAAPIKWSLLYIAAVWDIIVSRRRRIRASTSPSRAVSTSDCHSVSATARAISILNATFLI